MRGPVRSLAKAGKYPQDRRALSWEKEELHQSSRAEWQLQGVRAGPRRAGMP